MIHTRQHWQEIMHIHTSNSIADEVGYVFLTSDVPPATGSSLDDSAASVSLPMSGSERCGVWVIFSPFCGARFVASTDFSARGGMSEPSDTIGLGADAGGALVGSSESSVKASAASWTL